MSIISPHQYFLVASGTVAGNGYSALPAELLKLEESVSRQDPFAAFSLNKYLCRTLLNQFILADSHCKLPFAFHALYQQELLRIDSNLALKADNYFSLGNDPFRKDLGILRHRFIPCGAEFATPGSGISRALLLRGGWQQAAQFTRVIARCRGLTPFLELHMHPEATTAFNPSGWLETYDNLADLLALNPALRGVQSTSWFLDPALESISPHLVYLRRIPERCGAAILYAGDDNPDSSGAFQTSASRRVLYDGGMYRPRLFTRIWPRAAILQRHWRAPPDQI